MQALKKFAPFTVVVGGDAYLNDLNARDLKTRILGSYRSEERRVGKECRL